MLFRSSYTNAYMFGVSSTAWNNILVCGAFGLLAYFDGEKWKGYPDFFAPNSSLTFNNAWTSGRELFAVGEDDQGAYFVHGK